ncbi:MAG: hypothetical protein ACKOWD_08330 [Rhodoferax sp.]
MRLQYLALASLAVLAACASPAPGPGASEDATPPRLVRDTSGAVVWDRPTAFGPVPADKLAAGVTVCGGVSSYAKPGGYHSRAQNEYGVPFATGGYLCVAK